LRDPFKTDSHARYRSRRQDAKQAAKKEPAKNTPVPPHPKSLSSLRLHVSLRAPLKTDSHARYRSRRQDAKQAAKKELAKNTPVPPHPNSLSSLRLRVFACPFKNRFSRPLSLKTLRRKAISRKITN
jgi:hypothetical protein